jgi:peptidoglycan/xylan/chitin deacetylase (PgdA/CDA1 family)
MKNFLRNFKNCNWVSSSKKNAFLFIVSALMFTLLLSFFYGNSQKLFMGNMTPQPAVVYPQSPNPPGIGGSPNEPPPIEDPCHLWESENEADIPDAFGFPWDIWSDTKETTIKAYCLENDMMAILGNGDDSHLIWNTAYITKDQRNWRPISISGEHTTASGQWITGSASFSESMTPSELSFINYIGVYQCDYVDDEWKCGSRGKDASSQTLWDIQAFTYDGSDEVSSPAAVTLTAQPESLPVGKEKVLLTWKPEGDFSSCVASGHANWTGEKSVTENEEEVYGITETTTFTITCTDTLGNDVSDSVTVEKQQPILANYCGDGEVNQDWEACDGSSDCTEQCQLKTDPEPEGLVLARVNIEEFKNWNGGDASDTLYLGSTENAIPSGTWFPLQYISEDTVNLVGDDDITGYEDVPGLAVQRSRGESVRVVLYGSHNKKCNGACAASENPNEDYFDPLVTAQAKEYVSGSVEFFGAQVSAQRDDNSGNNRLEGDYTDGSGKGKYNAGDDEIWIENGLSKFWLVVTTADDGYWTDYEESQLTLGDVNTDGKVDVVDALAIASYIEEYGKNFSDFIADFTGITLIEEEFKQVADYSQDGIIGPFDPYSISRFNTGLPQLTLGDVNTDGKVDVVDALAIASYIEEYGKNFSDFIADFTGITLIEEEFKQVADYSQDGIIGPFDPYSISRFNTGLPQLTLGDVNTDGKVDVVDALAIASYIEEYGKNFSDFIADFTGITLIEEEFKQVADYSQDGIIGPFDPYSISRFNTGLPQLTLGDVNTDGKVDVVDALAIASYIEEYGKNFSDFIADFTGITLIEEEFKQVADYSQDGIIGPFDPYSISRFNTGLPQLTLGDVNTDGKVDVVDALAIASYIEEYGKNFSDFIADFTGITLIEEEFKQVADYSQDGIIGPFDPYSISRFNTGLPQLTLGDVNTDGKVDVVDALAIASYIEEYGKNFSDFIADFTGITLIEEEFKQVADYSQDGIIGPFDPYSISRFNTGLPQLTLGDVNTDGKVDVVDALAIASYIEEYGKNFSDFIADFTGITLIEEEFKQVADYSQDGIVSIIDSNLIVGLDPNIVSYCGDGEVNQDWEACDGSSDCTEQCQLKTDPEPEGLVLARVNIEEFKNWNGGDASDTLYLGSTENAIPSGTWFPLQYISEDTVNLVGDDDITGYEDVPGLAVQRSRGESVRVVLYGSHNKKCNGACAASENPNEDYFDPLVTAQAKEYVSGSVEFFGAQVSAQRDDNSGNNRLEGDYTDGSGKGKYNAGDDEIWIENGLSKFWLVVTTADDGYWTDYEESHPSPEETVIEINGFYDGDSSTLTACGGSAIEPKITFSWDHIEGERAAKYCKRTLGVGTLATCDITVPDTGSDPTELELYFSDADKGNTYDIEISPLDASNTEIGSTKKCRVTYEGKPSQNLDDPIITLNFDDGWKNQYENAKPILDAAGLKASYAIVTDTIDNAAQFGENYMTSDQIKDLVNSGNGIASHSTDALSLADLTAAEQRVRIKGSLTALVDLLGAAKVEKIFVFPNGSYDDTTIQIVEDEGYIGSRTAYPVGYNTSATDPYQLKVQQVNRDTTLDQVKTWIDTAVADKKWLILIFHQVADNPPNEYDTTPVMIREIAGYITSQGLTGNVKTLGEGFLEVYSGS